MALATCTSISMAIGQQALIQGERIISVGKILSSVPSEKVVSPQKPQPAKNVVPAKDPEAHGTSVVTKDSLPSPDALKGKLDQLKDQNQLLTKKLEETLDQLDRLTAVVAKQKKENEALHKQMLKSREAVETGLANAEKQKANTQHAFTHLKANSNAKPSMEAKTLEKLQQKTKW